MFMCFVSIVGTSNGQTQNGHLKYNPKLDSLWSNNAFLMQLSKDGNWATINEIYDYKDDNYFLINTSTKKKTSLGTSFKQEFSSNSEWLAFLSEDNELDLIRLSDNKILNFPNIQNFEFNTLGNYVSIVKKESDGLDLLMLIDLETFTELHISDVVNFVWNPTANKIAYSTKSITGNQIVVYDFKKKRGEKIWDTPINTYNHLQWSKTGNSLSFMEKDTSGMNLHIILNNGKKNILTTTLLSEHFPEDEISDTDVTLSDDGTSVYFYRNKIDQTEFDGSTMEIWETTDPWIYPGKTYYDTHENKYFLTLWDIVNNKITKITDHTMPSVQYNPNHSYVLLYDRQLYEPQYKQYQYADVYIMDLLTGIKKLLVEKQYMQQGNISLSPKGHYVAFFKDNDWWIYDIAKDETTNCTANIRADFTIPEMYGSINFLPYGSPGWTEVDSELMIYDTYDIWTIATNGKTGRKMTNGSDRKIKFRISRDERKNDSDYIEALRQYNGISYNLDKGLILEMIGDDLQTGYAWWRKSDALKTIYYGPLLADNILLNSDKVTGVFKKSKYNFPPAFYHISSEESESTVIYQSNSQLLNYDLGKDIIYEYITQKEDTLSALLFYPTNYEPERKYPLIVKLYETFSLYDLKFNAPTPFEAIGFNLLNYTTDDYFVLIPTIIYDIGNPGISALNDVTSAVESATKLFPIDDKRIGLIGHSFGGYEASYIATQSNLFATAVAGCAVSDLGNYYHDISWDFKKEQIWRLESQQFRMGAPYHLSKENYRHNSPINHVANMETPLLLWNGNKDFNTNWTQGINMYMAMKRAKKKGKLLLFKDEGHFLVKPENQLKLTSEIKNWFNHYLKKE